MEDSSYDITVEDNLLPLDYDDSHDRSSIQGTIEDPKASFNGNLTLRDSAEYPRATVKLVQTHDSLGLVNSNGNNFSRSVIQQPKKNGRKQLVRQSGPLYTENILDYEAKERAKNKSRAKWKRIKY